MKCLTGFMRKGCEIGIADRVNDLGAMVDAIVPVLWNSCSWCHCLRNNRKNMRKFVEKECVL